jgi:hypothetical protein
MIEQQDFDFTAPPSPPPPKAPPMSNGAGDNGDRPRTRQQQMFRRFKKFHTQNPRIWKLYEADALELAKSFEHYSSDEVIQRIRWHKDITTRDDAPYDKIKISDHYRAYYARLFHVAHPEHAGFFRNKKLRSEDYGPFKHEPSPDGEPAGPEFDLTEQLRELL